MLDVGDEILVLHDFLLHDDMEAHHDIKNVVHELHLEHAELRQLEHEVIEVLRQRHLLKNVHSYMSAIVVILLFLILIYIMHDVDDHDIVLILLEKHMHIDEVDEHDDETL